MYMFFKKQLVENIFFRNCKIDVVYAYLVCKLRG